MLDHGSIQELPLSHPHFRKQVEAFLLENGLRMESLDHYYAWTAPDGSIIAGAGIKADVIKCVAVASSARSEGCMLPLLSRVVSDAAAAGILNLKVFTKPENLQIFESIGFHEIARAPKAVLMENGKGLERYCEYLSGICKANGALRHARPRPGISGVIVMNANPFTLGHKYLIEKALEQVDHLYIIPVKEDVSAFPYSERLAMIRSGVMPGSGSPVMPDSDRASALPASSLMPDSDRASAHLSSEQKYFSGRCPKNHFSSDIASPTHADARITVLEGSDYCISAATFPTYFLKDLSDAAETQMLLDLDLFSRWISPALGNPVRFVGSEPSDPLTARYNDLMAERINTCVIERLSYRARRPSVSQISVMPDPDRASAQQSSEENYFLEGFPKNQFPSSSLSPTHADAVTATAVRSALERGRYQEAAALCPETTHPYLLAALAERALVMELDTPLKPGLVGPDSNGAHSDMNYATMMAGIKALRPFWSRMALAASPEELREAGIEAERAMMEATGGVNTHRGAIFCLGLALNAAAAWRQGVDIQEFMQKRLPEIAQTVLHNQLRDSKLAPRPEGIKDARAMALDGYRDLFEDWLPFYHSLCHSENATPCHSERSEESAVQLTLLRIMSTLDDTCIIKRVGQDRAQKVKLEAASVLQTASALPASEENYFSGRCPKNQFSPDIASPTHADALKDLCIRYARERISPGGAADMLALTIFIDSIIW
ncbi:MAG: triphosphoribosyl-dephospho-CoA synthase [Bacteroidales bacterium]|nr:triphosphoribosyl-dephospho-CoA synthase [Bacteroidales bacterium]